MQTEPDQKQVDVGCIKELTHLLGMAKIVRDTKEAGKTSTRAAGAGALAELTEVGEGCEIGESGIGESGEEEYGSEEGEVGVREDGGEVEVEGVEEGGREKRGGERVER